MSAKGRFYAGEATFSRLGRHVGTFAAACAATMVGDLLRSVAKAGFVRLAGLSRCDASLPQALFLPPPSRSHNGHVVM